MMLPIVVNLPAGRKHHWRYIIIDVRLGRENFKGPSDWAATGNVMLTRRCIGPMAFSYVRSTKA